MSDDLRENDRLRRCEITGNPVGSDTWTVGYVCPCRECQAAYGPEVCPVCGGDCGSANPPVLYCPMREP